MVIILRQNFFAVLAPLLLLDIHHQLLVIGAFFSDPLTYLKFEEQISNLNLAINGFIFRQLHVTFKP